MTKKKQTKVDKRIDDSFIDIENKNNEAVQRLFKEVGINEVDRDGRTLLLNASCYKNRSLVNWALKNGASINHQDYGGWSALHFAIQDNNLSITKLLIEKNINLDLKDDYGNTALAVGVFNNCKPGIIKLMLDNGADPKKRNKSKVSTLDILKFDKINSKIKDLFKGYIKTKSSAKKGKN